MYRGKFLTWPKLWLRVQARNEWGETRIWKTRVTEILWWNWSSFGILIREDYALCTLLEFLPLKLALFINSPLELINFTLFGVWTCHDGFMVLKTLGSQISFGEVFGLILMCCNFGGWFLLGHPTSSLVFLITFSNSLCSQLWKVITFSMSIFGSSSHSRLLAWPTSALSYKTCFDIFFILLVNIVGIL